MRGRGLVFLVLGTLSLVPGDASAQISAKLGLSTVSGPAPLLVFFDATGSGCGSNCNPFHDLLYEWTFGGEPAANWAKTGKPKNKAMGPLAAHVFETPGEKTITLKVTDRSGATAQAPPVTVRVEAADTYWAGSDTYCFSTSGDYTGCPAGAVTRHTSNLDSALAECIGSHRRCLFRRNEKFSGSGTTIRSPGPSMIGAFGQGNGRPRLGFNNDGPSFSFEQGASGWRFVDLEMEGLGGGSSKMLNANRRIQNMLFLRIRGAANTYSNYIGLGGNALDLSGDAPHDLIAFVETDLQMPIAGAAHYVMFVNSDRLVMLGNVFASNAYTNTRIQHARRGVISQNEFSGSTSQQSTFTLRSRDQNSSCSTGCRTPTEKILISDNVFMVSEDFGISMTGAGKSTELPLGRDLIFERNFIKKHPSIDHGPQVLLDVRNSQRISVRNNIGIMNRWQTYRGFSFTDSVREATITNNTCYSSDDPGIAVVRCVDVSPGSMAAGSYAYNNLAYFPMAQSKMVVQDESALARAESNMLVPANPFRGEALEAPEDFRLADGSAAINRGVDDRNPIVDFDGVRRPAGPGIDVGAFELPSEGAPNLPPAAPLLLD